MTGLVALVFGLGVSELLILLVIGMPVVIGIVVAVLLVTQQPRQGW